MENRGTADALDPAVVIEALFNVSPSDTVVSNDAGNFAAYLHRYWQYRTARSQVAPTNGAMGYGVPGAIAAKLALPSRPVLGVTGDGGFLMTGNEIETAVREGLDLTIAVLRNGLYGTIAMHQAATGRSLAAVVIGEVDIAGYARSLGAQGVSVTTSEELAEACQHLHSHRGVTVLDIKTDPDLISPASRLSDLRRQPRVR